MVGISGIYNFRSHLADKIQINYNLYNDRFQNDCCYAEDVDFLIAVEGCILNLKKLKQELSIENTHHIIKNLWTTYGERIIRKLKGTYLLVIYDKKKECLFISNDLLSKRPLYVYKSEDLLFFSSRYFDLLNIIKRCNMKFSLNKVAIAMMLIKGYLGDNITYIKEIDYIRAFEYIKIENNEYKKCSYEMLKTPILDSEENIIENLDVLFSSAVEGQFQKNTEYNYKQLCTLSAGMDSRMCLLYAKKLGYENILCISYAQSESVDYSVSKKIAFDYKYEYIFYPLDSASFLKEVHALSSRNECQQIYAGATGAFKMIELLDTSNYGIIHTGSLGGELLSDIFKTPGYKKVKLGNNAMKSLPLWDEETEFEFREMKAKYEHEEDYLLFENTRTTQNFFRMVDYKCEAFSPFMDEDFFSYVYRISPELRYRRYLYSKWMKKCIPNDYITTYFKTKVGENHLKNFTSKAMNKIVRKIRMKSKFDMSPMEYWGKVVPGLRTSLDGLYEENEKYMDMIPDCIRKSIQTKKNAGVTGTIMAITVMEAIKRIYKNEVKSIVL